MTNEGMLKKPSRVTDKKYMDLVRENTDCLIKYEHQCVGEKDIAHIKTRGSGGSDHQVVILCRKAHSEQHQLGTEGFQQKYGVNMYKEALENLLKWKLNE